MCYLRSCNLSTPSDCFCSFGFLFLFLFAHRFVVAPFLLTDLLCKTPKKSVKRYNREADWKAYLLQTRHIKFEGVHFRWINSSNQQLSQGASSEQQRDGWPVIAKQRIVLIKWSNPFWCFPDSTYKGIFRIEEKAWNKLSVVILYDPSENKAAVPILIIRRHNNSNSEGRQQASNTLLNTLRSVIMYSARRLAAWFAKHANGNNFFFLQNQHVQCKCMNM